MHGCNESATEAERFNLHILVLKRSESAEGPLAGWQAGFAIDSRALWVGLLLDLLRMFGSSVDLDRSIDISLAFERKQFMESSIVDDYRESTRQKLGTIRLQS